MSRTNNWVNTSPADHTKFEAQPGHVRDLRVDIEERLSNILYGFATSAETEDFNGFKMLPLVAWGTPSTPTGTGSAAAFIHFGSSWGGQVEWFGIDSGGSVIQFTSGGSLYALRDYLNKDGTVKLTGSWDMGTGSAAVVSMVATSASVQQLLGITHTGAVTNLNADKLDGYDYNETEIKPLGAWAARSNNTVYQAATDGFFACIITAGGSVSAGRVVGDTDGSNPPATQRGAASVHVNTGISSQSAYSNWNSFCFPVKKGDYYRGVKASTGNAPTVIYYWIPIGT